MTYNNFGTFSTGALASNEEPFDEVVEIRVCVSVCVCGPAKSNLVDGGFDAKVDFERGGRADLVAANETEIRVLEKYLPQGLDPAKLDALIAEAIQQTGAQSKKEMGKVIAALKQRPEAGLIDFGVVSKLVQAKLP